MENNDAIMKKSISLFWRSGKIIIKKNSIAKR